MVRFSKYIARLNRNIEVWGWPLKPYYWRVVELAQGLEFDDVVVVLDHLAGKEGKVYTALSRGKSMERTCLEGVLGATDEAKRNFFGKALKADAIAILLSAALGREMPQDVAKEALQRWLQRL